MNRADYEKTKDYIKALEGIREFTEKVFGGNIDALRDFCFDDLTEYIGEIHDPDMFWIVQAIYIVLWGDIYDLTFDKMGKWDLEGTHAFRGDTMNSFGSLFGKESQNKEFGFRAKYFGADKNPELWNKIEKFYKMYHWLGNFIVIPNRASLRNGINGARAGYYNRENCEGMRDYFDWFLKAVAEYQGKVKKGSNDFNKFESQLQRNPEYSPFFLDIKDWEECFFLKDYFKDGKPELLFQTPLDRRLMITAELEERRGVGYYQDEEYLAIIEDYLDKSMAVIVYRTNKMVDVLKEKIL